MAILNRDEQDSEILAQKVVRLPPEPLATLHNRPPRSAMRRPSVLWEPSLRYAISHEPPGKRKLEPSHKGPLKNAHFVLQSIPVNPLVGPRNPDFHSVGNLISFSQSLDIFRLQRGPPGRWGRRSVQPRRFRRFLRHCIRKGSVELKAKDEGSVAVKKLRG
jgi:hypothetical protein